jgi:hypothetical protein
LLERGPILAPVAMDDRLAELSVGGPEALRSDGDVAVLLGEDRPIQLGAEDVVPEVGIAQVVVMVDQDVAEVGRDVRRPAALRGGVSVLPGQLDDRPGTLAVPDEDVRGEDHPYSSRGVAPQSVAGSYSAADRGAGRPVISRPS